MDFGFRESWVQKWFFFFLDFLLWSMGKQSHKNDMKINLNKKYSMYVLKMTT